MKNTLHWSTVLLAALGVAACNRSADAAPAQAHPTRSTDGPSPMHLADPGAAHHHDMGDTDQHGSCGTQAATPAHKGTIAVTVGDEGFMPSRIALKRGEKSTLRFTRTSDKTCATEVVFPELGIKKSLPLNQPVDIDVPVDRARTLTFQCGMGMFKSQVVVRG
jgi:hypothetical protein